MDYKVKKINNLGKIKLLVSFILILCVYIKIHKWISLYMTI